MKYNGNEFVDRIMELLNVKKQSQLSDILDINEESISRWRTRKRFPQVNTLIKIEHVINHIDIESDPYHDNFDFAGITIKDNALIFSANNSKAFSELFKKYSAIKQTFDFLEEEQIILLINNIIEENKKKYILVDYAE